MKWIFSLLAVTISFASPAFTVADGPEQKPAETPEIAFDNCLQAIIDHDHEKYVSLLSEKEVRSQTGWILFLSRMVPLEEVKKDQPEMYLLGRAVMQLIDDRIAALPASPLKDQQLSNYETLPDQIMQESIALASKGLGFSPKNMEEKASELSHLLSDPQQFLVDVLDVMSEPTTVSGDAGVESEALLYHTELAHGFQAAKWAIYTRGKYALAEMHQTPESEKQIRNLIPLPKITVEFVKQGDQWLIDRLLPIGFISTHEPKQSNSTYKHSSSSLSDAPVFDQNESTTPFSNTTHSVNPPFQREISITPTP